MLDRKRGRRLVVLAWMLLVAALLGVREVNPPDEPRFIQQAKEMRDSGDWLVPRIGGVPIPDKPPILFWSINLLSLPLNHIVEGVARIPSALAALVVLLLTARVGRRLFPSVPGAPAESALDGEAVGNGAALILLTAVEFFQKAQWISCDMLLAAWVAITIVCWREALFDGEGVRWRVFAGWLAVAGGVLTKGPVALLWPMLWVLAEGCARARLRPLLRLFQPYGPLAMLAIVSAWLLAVAQRVGWDFLANAVFTQSVSRYANAWNSVQPWYFYFGQLPVDFLPWSLLLPAVLVFTWTAFSVFKHAPGASWVRTLALFFVLGFAFFSGSSGKRGVYLLPAFPALALLISAAFLASFANRGVLARLRSAGLYAASALGLLLALGIPYLLARGGGADAPTVIAKLGRAELSGLVLAGLTLAGGSVAAARLAWSRRAQQAALISMALGTALFLFLGGLIGGLAWNRHQNARAYGRTVAALVPRDARIAIDRRKFELILFYSDRQGTEVETDAQLLDELRSGRCRFAIARGERLDSLGATPPIDSMPRLDSSRLGVEAFHLLGPAAR